MLFMLFLFLHYYIISHVYRTDVQSVIHQKLFNIMMST